MAPEAKRKSGGDALMVNRFAGFRNLAQGIFFWAVIIIIIFGVLWLILSGVANCTNFGEPEEPGINKAQYEVFIHANAKTLYTDDLDAVADGKYLSYVLHGYYEYFDDKFEYRDKDLLLEERYFGKISVNKR